MEELIIEKIDGYDVIACPFCGKSELILSREGIWKWICCTNIDCRATGPMDLGISGAIAAWNERKNNEEELIKVLDELTDLIDDTIEGSYVPDSFTTQPARILLHKLLKND